MESKMPTLKSFSRYSTGFQLTDAADGAETARPARRATELPAERRRDARAVETAVVLARPPRIRQRRQVGVANKRSRDAVQQVGNRTPCAVDFRQSEQVLPEHWHI